MQPYLFPYLGYFQLINACDKFVFLDDVNFIKKGWINRNNILVNNESNLFTIPLKNASQNIPISETFIVNDSSWKIEFERKINFAYKKAPYFKNVYDLINSILYAPCNTINQLAKKSILEVCLFLDLKKTFVDSSTIYDNSELKGEERILDICIKENATQYINPIGGLNLYLKEHFINNKIDLFFIKNRSESYPQFSNAFVNNLSIIDVLMFNTSGEVKRLLSQYELI